MNTVLNFGSVILAVTKGGEWKMHHDVVGWLPIAWLTAQEVMGRLCNTPNVRQMEHLDNDIKALLAA